MLLSHKAEALLKAKAKTKRGKETFARICEAAERQLTANGYYGTRIEDIAKSIDVSVGTFYIYFHDKLGLYKYIVLQYCQKLRKYIATRLAAMNLTTRIEIEREGLKLFLGFCVENPAIFHLIWQSLFVAPELLIEYYDDFCKQYEKQLSYAVRSGEVRHMNLEVLSYALMGSINLLAMKYVIFSPPSGVTDEQLYRVVDEWMLVLKHGMFICDPSSDS